MSSRARFFRRAIAWPTDHGSWVFLLSPLIIGLAAGGRWTTPAVYLVVAALCGFLVRQPATVAVKALSGRRRRRDLGAALAWAGFYATLGTVHVAGLVIRGLAYLLWLAIPGLAVFAWYLYLVARREERRKIGMEIVGAGVLALTAPAGLWVGSGAPTAAGWWLWGLTWAQMAASIVYVYLRLEQRSASDPRALTARRRLRVARPALAFATGNLAAVILLTSLGWLGRWLFLAYLPQWLAVIAGALRPAVGLQPTRIGLRQLALSGVYTLIFVLTWS